MFPLPRVGDALLAHCLNCIRLRRALSIHSHHSIPHQLHDGPQVCLSADPARVTHHPEVPLGSLGEFETCPDWVPVMDTGQQFARIALKTMGDHGFDQRADQVAKVRNVSNVGANQNCLCNSVFCGRPKFTARTRRLWRPTLVKPLVLSRPRKARPRVHSRKRGLYVPAVRSTVSSHSKVNNSADLLSPAGSAPGLASTLARRDVKSCGRDENRSMIQLGLVHK
jgi:hypothetical protein